VVLVALFALAAVNAQPDPSWQQTALAVWAILLTAPGLALTILWTRDAVSRARAIADDLCDGRVLTYTGEEGQIIEVLAASRRVWQSAGTGWAVAPGAVTVAEPPSVAAIAAEWLQPAPGRDDLMIGKRELSGPECDELRRFAASLWKRPLLPAIGLTLWLAMPITMLFLNGRLGGTWEYVRFALLAAVTLLADCHLVRRLVEATRLRRDAVRGDVVILRAMGEGAETRPIGREAGGGTVEVGGEAVELLPVTFRVWTVGGRPAEWRLTRP
jgi:hypothetical protein